MKRLIFISFIVLVYWANCSSGLQAQKRRIDTLWQKKSFWEKHTDFDSADTTYINFLAELTYEHEYHHIDSIEFYANRILNLSQQLNYQKGMASAYLFIARTEYRKGRYKEALSTYEKAKTLAINTNSNSILANIYNELGNYYDTTNNRLEAYNAYRQGLMITEKYGLTETEIFLNLNLAILFFQTGHLDTQLEYYTKALEGSKKVNNESLKASVEYNMGQLFLKRNELAKAKEYFNNAFITFRKIDNPTWLAFTHFGMADVANKEKNYATALEHSNEGLSMLNDSLNHFEKAQGYLSLAQTHFNLEDNYDAETYANKANSIADEFDFNSIKIELFKILYQINKKKNLPKKALSYLEKLKHLSDSLMVEESTAQLQMLEAQNKFEMEQEQKQLINDKKLRARNKLIYATSILFLALTIIAFLILRNIRIQKKSNQELKEINLAKNKVFSILGHDLKSPINTLKELLSLYGEKGFTDEDISKIAPRLKKNVDHSAFTLNNLLTWANNQMDGLTTVPTAVPIKDHAVQVVGLYMENIENKKINVECLTNPELKVWVDADHLDLILRNIILNAIKFTDNNGLIQFNGKVEGEHIVFSIRDTGTGMTKKQISSILNGKTVDPKSGTNKEKGTGIGIQITKELIHLNNGKIEIESTLNVGTTVKIILPRATTT